MDLSTRDRIIIIDDDDEIIVIDDEEDSGCQVTRRDVIAARKPPPVIMSPRLLPSCVSLLALSDNEPSQIIPQPLQLGGPSTEPQFRTPNYGSRVSCPTSRTSCARFPRSQRRLDSLPAPRPCPFLSSRTSKTACQDSGTLSDPIELDSDHDDLATDSQRTMAPRCTHSSSNMNIQNETKDEDHEMNLNGVEPPPYQEVGLDINLQRDLAQNVQRMEVIDLDELEDDQEDELRILAVQNIRPEEDLPEKQARLAKALKIPRRNPSMAEPWTSCSSYQYGNLSLKPNKTVELLDGDFVRIRDIWLNAATPEIKIRGNRFQRTRDLNGLLERKMNELVLFLEVDLDDPRPSLEQAAVEIPLKEIKKIRSLRFTNQKFPLDRNLQPLDFRNRDAINAEGGLTCRWKYTCTYATGADRHHNIHKERRLERIRADECTGADVLSDEDRLSQWREQTVPGGAYMPSLMVVERSPNIGDGSSGLEEQNLAPLGPQPSLTQCVNQRRASEPPEVMLVSRIEKRKYSDKSTISEDIQDGRKRTRYGAEVAVEETRRYLSRYNIGPAQRPDVEEPDMFDSSMILDSQSTEDQNNGGIANDASSLLQEALPSVPQSISVLSLELSIPPPSGSIHTPSLYPPTPVQRLPGQKLTYGDAFCGGGGSTRGALMAGLHIKWGFDFNKHACSTWTINFPLADCYNESSHDFVTQVQRSSQKELFKVDILHLSPPCQFFSPAHTVEGQDDEMNVASLFAVRSVIEAARPRVVTLEQTFGIVNERFRWFFNALVQMFTSHEFSVRWAVIPLQMWGLPQRRMRLIIIASCPGETLPRMPDPTHVENPPLGSTLKPYVSVNSVLASIPHNAADHDPLSVMFAEDKRMAPWDGSKILPRAMTTSGGQNYHTGGRRDFTLREYACLQGFPVCHLFRGNYIKKQIGNAVPPVVAKVLFESVKRDLDLADGIVDDVEVLE